MCSRLICILKCQLLRELLVFNVIYNFSKICLWCHHVFKSWICAVYVIVSSVLIGPRCSPTTHIYTLMWLANSNLIICQFVYQIVALSFKLIKKNPVQWVYIKVIYMFLFSFVFVFVNRILRSDYDVYNLVCKIMSGLFEKCTIYWLSELFNMQWPMKTILLLHTFSSF